jgi:hypothetical protein
MLTSTNKVDIELYYGDLTPIINWCERNCTEEWGYNIIETPGSGKGKYEFYFENDKDKVAFIMWKK